MSNSAKCIVLFISFKVSITLSKLWEILLPSKCIIDNYIILDGLEGDTRIYCQRSQKYCPPHKPRGIHDFILATKSSVWIIIHYLG